MRDSFAPLAAGLLLLCVTTCAARLDGPADPDTPIAYLHIPKNGGTSVDQYLKYNWGKKCSEVSLEGRNTDAGISQAASTSCVWSHVLVGPGRSERQRLRDLASCTDVRFRYLTGHLDFGMCNYIETGCEYVTVLREPLTRMLSHYKYVVKRHPDLLETVCAKAPGGCANFTSYVQGVYDGHIWFYGVANMQTLFMAGAEFHHASHACWHEPQKPLPTGDYDAQLLRTAKNNLATRTTFGFLEDLDEFQDVMKARFGYDKMYIPKLNISPGVELEHLDPKTLWRMRQVQRMDLELYSFAKRVLKQRKMRLMGRK